MGVISLGNSQDKALLSPQFSLIASDVMSNMTVTDNRREKTMKLMYFSLLIYINEHLKVPRQFVMAIGNGLEKNRNSMEIGELMTTYVTILRSGRRTNSGLNSC